MVGIYARHFDTGCQPKDLRNACKPRSANVFLRNYKYGGGGFPNLLRFLRYRSDFYVSELLQRAARGEDLNSASANEWGA